MVVDMLRSIMLWVVLDPLWIWYSLMFIVTIGCVWPQIWGLFVTLKFGFETLNLGVVCDYSDWVKPEMIWGSNTSLSAYVFNIMKYIDKEIRIKKVSHNAPDK